MWQPTSLKKFIIWQILCIMSFDKKPRRRGAFHREKINFNGNAHWKQVKEKQNLKSFKSCFYHISNRYPLPKTLTLGSAMILKINLQPDSIMRKAFVDTSLSLWRYVCGCFFGKVLCGKIIELFFQNLKSLYGCFC